MVVGDFNADGKPDLVVANSGSDNISILLGTGSGNFGQAINSAAGSYPYSMALGDFNGDGKPDLAVANYGSNNVSVMSGQGNGSFGLPINLAVGLRPKSIVAADLNSDGKPDLAVANYGSHSISLLLNAGFSITTQPATGSAVCVGSSVTTRVMVSGTSLSYQWYKDSFSTPVASQTAATLSLTNVTETDAGSYSAVITGACTSITTSAFSLTVNALPSTTLTTSNSGILSCSIQTLTLTATPSSSFTYAFSNGAVQINNGNTAAVHAPGVYTVTVTGANGCSATASTSVTGSTAGVGQVTALVSGVLGMANPIVTISAGAAGATSYTLTGPGIYTTGSTGLFPVSQAGTYQVSAGNGTGSACVSTTLVHVRAGLPAQVFSYTATVPLTSSPIRLSVPCQGYSFRFTGPGGYVFSNLYRTGGQYVAVAHNITLPGPYVLTAYGEDGSQVQVVITVTVPAGKLLVPAPGTNGSD